MRKQNMSSKASKKGEPKSPASFFYADIPHMPLPPKKKPNRPKGTERSRRRPKRPLSQTKGTVPEIGDDKQELILRSNEIIIPEVARFRLYRR
jgi:hypothetical protein